MLKFNTQARLLHRLFSHEQVFKATPPLPNGLKTGFLATLFCCLFSINLTAQCDIVCPASMGYNLSLNVMGQATLDPTVFEPLVSSSFTQCLPVNGGVLEIWEDAAGTIPYPTALPGPNFNCTDIGVAFTVYVTLNDLGPGVQSPTCQFDVAVVDNVVPIIFPPGSITVSTDPGPSCASVQSLTATVVDNCLGNLTLSHVLTGATTGTFPGFTANHAYNEGVTTITWRVDDGVNPLFTSTTTVTVLDLADPNFVGALPGDQTISANASCEGITTFFVPNVADNCGVSNTGPSLYTMTLDFPFGVDPVIDVHPGGMNSAIYYPASTFPLGTTTVTLDVVDDNGNSISHSFDITVVDNTPPAFDPGAPTTINVSPPGCASFVTIDVGPVTDNCTSPVSTTFTVTQTSIGGGPPPFTSGVGDDASGTYPVGTYEIEFTATDNAGNMSTHIVTLTVEDLIDPVAVCQNVTVSLDANGDATVTAMDVDGGSTDNCPPLDSFSIRLNGVDPWVSELNFDCSDLPSSPIPVRFRVWDSNLNTDADNTCEITIVDNMPPIAICQDITVNLGGGPPTADVFAAAVHGSPFINNGSNDNCTLMGDLVIRIRKGTSGPFAPLGDPVTFDCSETGANTVEIRVRDDEGNVNFCQATVTVNDVTLPTPSCTPITVELDAVNGTFDLLDPDPTSTTTYPYGGAPIPIPDVSSVSSTINVPASSLIGDLDVSLDITHTWTGDLVVTLTSPKGTEVTLLDEPCGSDDDVLLTLDDEAVSGVPCPAVGGGFHLPFEALSTFDGENMLGDWTLTVTDDAAGDVGTINDWSLTLTETYLSLLGAGSTDDCACTTWTSSQSMFDCTDLGSNPVTVTVSDASGNTATCSTTVTVEDNTDPVITCPVTPYDVFLDATGNVSVPASLFAPNVDDNCTVIEIALQKQGFFGPFGPWSNTQGDVLNYDCGDVDPFPPFFDGLHDVRVWARDQSNNPSATPSFGTSTVCTDAINVIDNIPPAAGCVDLSVAVGTNGQVLVTAFQLGLASSDNCTGTLFLLREMSVDTDGDGNGDTPWSANYTFDCDDILTNPNVVEVRVTDEYGNSSICKSDVTIEDNEDPVITCPADVTIECDEDDTPASLGTATAIDNCAMPPTILPHSDVISSMVCTGEYIITRTWTAEDDYGNQDMCDQIITVEDNTAPTFAAPADVFGLECPDSYDVANFECQNLVSNDPNLPIDITDNMTTTIVSTLPVSVPANGKITDVKVSLQVAHTRVEDLEVTLQFTPIGFISPTVSETLFSAICPGEQNVDLMLMDGAPTIPCPPVDQANFYTPTGSLAAFNGQFMNGTWELVIADTDPAPNGGGQLLGWSLDVCFIPQAGDLSLTGDVVASDNCDPDPSESYFDYHAYKDFTSHAEGGAYNFSTGAWSYAELPFGHDGFLSTGGAPSSISLTGANNGTSGAESNYGITIPAGGVGPFFMVFDWDYLSNNGAASFDAFGYKINGTFFPLTEVNGCAFPGIGATAQSGRAIVAVSPGDFFEFSQQSCDGILGSATTTITNFLFVDGGCPLPAVDCPREFCIARFWDVVDDCGNSADSQVQIISTGDTNGPSFGAAPATMTVIAPPGICTPNITIDFSAFIDDGGCSDYDNLTIWNSALGDFGTGDGMANASGFYAPGTYVIEFEATDECGNITYHTLTLEVIDDQDPDAKCVNYTVQLNNNGEATVLLTDVDNGSLDNCPGMTLSFAAPPASQVSTLLLNTGDIGQTPITLYAIDASGNVSSCVSIVTVLGGVLIDAEDVAGTSGSTAMVPVVTNDEFTDIGSFSTKLEIVDGSVAEIVAGGVTIHPDLAALGGILSFNVVSTTEVMVSWISNSPFGSTLIPPNTGLFMVEVDLVGAAGTSTSIKVEDDVVNRIIGGISTTVPSFGLAGTISVLNTANNFSVGGPLVEAPICGSDDIHLVDVELTGAPSVPASPIMNAAGTYSFDVPQGSSPTIMPTKDVTWFDGSVDIFDVLLVNQHFLGIPPLLNSPFKILAADINQNNSVDIADVFAINQVSLGNLPAGLGDPWAFVDDDHVFTNPLNPWNAPIPNSIMLINVQADVTDAGFIGYHLGDVDCSVDPTMLGNEPVSDGNGGQLPFVALDQAFAAGQTFTVEFKAQDFVDYIGYQTSIQFDPQVVEFVEFLPSANLTNLTTANFNPTQAGEGLLATNWYNLDAVTLENGETVFSIQFKALQDVASLANLLAFNGELIAGKAVKLGGGIHGVDLVFESPTAANEVTGDGFALYQNRPNPFGFRTEIGFTLPESATATLTISDASGKVLKVIEGHYTAGYHQVGIDRTDLAANGVLLYRLETATHTAVKKMVLLD